MGKRTIFILILAVLAIRLIPAYLIFGSFDMGVWYFFSEKVLEGKNVYTEDLSKVEIIPSQPGPINAAYTPFWFYLIAGLRYISNAFNLPFYFIVKFPAIIADIVITLLIYIISLKFGFEKKKSFFISLLYGINPIPILYSSAHGQFDAIAIMFVLLAAYFFMFKQKKHWSALFLGFAVVSKNFPIILLPLFLLKLKNWNERARYTLLTIIPVALILAPFMLISKESFIGVVNNVFLYRGGFGYWGYPLSLIIVKYSPFTLFKVISNSPWFIAIFNEVQRFGNIFTLMAIILSYALIKSDKIIKSILIIFLTFYTFTIGMGSYLVWVLPFALLIKDRKIIPYTIFASLYLTINLLRTESLIGYNGIAHLFNLPYPNMSILKYFQAFFGLITWAFTLYWLYCLTLKEIRKKDIGVRRRRKKKKQDLNMAD